MHTGKTILRRYDEQALKRHATTAQGKVLDVGCGAVSCKELLNCDEYIRLDFARQDKPDILTELHALGIRGSSFDTVICSNVLEHLREPKKATGEIHRILKPNGTLLVSVPFLIGIHPDPIDMQRFTPAGLQAVLSDFEIERVEQLGGYFSVAFSVADDFLNLFIGRRLSGLLFKLGKFLDSIHLLPAEKRSKYAIGNLYAVGFFAVCRKVQQPFKSIKRKSALNQP